MFLIIMSLLFQAKCNAACLEKEDFREQNSKMQTEICDLKETLERHVASNRIEVSFHTFNVIRVLTRTVDNRIRPINGRAI